MSQQLVQIRGISGTCALPLMGGGADMSCVRPKRREWPRTGHDFLTRIGWDRAKRLPHADPAARPKPRS